MCKKATYLETLGLLHSSLHHIHISLLDSANAEIYSGTHFLDLDTRQRLPTLLCRNHVCAQTNLGCGLCILLFSNRDVHHILQTLHIHIIRIFAFEKVEKQTFGHGVCV